MAMSADYTVAEVNEIVDVGGIQAEGVEVILQWENGCFSGRIVSPLRWRSLVQVSMFE